MVPHMLMQSMPVREALGVATSTHEKEVKVPPHMAEGSVGVLINNSAVGTERHLPSPSLNGHPEAFKILPPHVNLLHDPLSLGLVRLLSVSLSKVVQLPANTSTVPLEVV